MAKLVFLLGWASYYAIANCAITTLYPLMAAEHEIAESYIGQVLGIYSISSFIFLPISMWLLKRCSDLLVFQLGLTFLALVLILVAFMPTIQDASFFLAMSFLFRIMEGASDIMISMAIMNIIQKAQNKDVYLNLLMGFFSIGCALGPFLVSILVTPLGFTGFYLGLSAIVLASALTCRILHNYFSSDSKTQELLDSLSQYDTAASFTDRLTLEVAEEQVTELSFLQMLKIKKVFVGLLFFMVVSSLWTFRDPILPIHLKSQGVPTEDIPMFYLTQTLSNAVFGLTPLFFVKLMSPRSLILCGSVVIFISLFLIGPSFLLGLGNSILLLQVGLGVLGAAFNYAFSPVVSDLMKGINEQYPWASNPEKLSLLYLASRSLGYWMGPFLGSILYEQFNFALTCDLFAIFFAIMICIYSDLLCSILRLCRPSTADTKHVLQDSYRSLNGGTESTTYI